MRAINVDNLIIEVTRRCNAACPHCLRGDAQKGDIDIAYIERLFDYVKYVGTITFSGGEPSLYVDAIRKTLEIVVAKQVAVTDIYVVTNGIEYSQELVDVMFDWLQYCMCCEGVEIYDVCVDDYLADGEFGIALSIDDYHPEPSIESLVKYRSLKFYRNDHELYDDNPANFIREGRAVDYGIGERDLEDYKYSFNVDDDFEELSTLYLNVKGNVYPCCDFSYETQDRVIGNVNIMERSLTDIVLDENVHYDYFNHDVII